MIKDEGWIEKVRHLGGALSALLKAFFYLALLMMFVGGLGLFGSNTAPVTELLYGKGARKIAVIDISGVIVEEAGSQFDFSTGSITTVRGVMRTLESIKADDKIVAVVLRVNSPGGSVTASDEIYGLLKRFKSETKLPIVVSQGDLAASGGYYVSLAGDTIVASRTTLTGSVGTIIESVNFKELGDKLGIKGVVIKSGKHKDILNPFEDIDGADLALLQEIVNEGQQQFVSLIIERRPATRGRILEFADGRVLSGQQAKNMRLVDTLGSFHDAVEIAKDWAGVKEAQVVVFGKKTFLESFLGSLSRKFDLTSGLNITTNHLRLLNGQPAYLHIP